MFIKHFLAYGPNGDKAGKIAVIQRTEKYTYNNPSNHEQEPRTKQVWDVKGIYISRAEHYIISEKMGVDTEEKLYSVLKEVETSLMKYMNNEANKSTEKSWKNTLIFNGYVDK